MDGATAHRALLSREPELAALLEGVARIYAGPPVQAVLCTGGVAMGEFSPHCSDVDLVVVLPRVLECCGDLPEREARVRRLPYGQRADLLYVERRDVGTEAPRGRRLDGSTYGLHAIDVIQLARHSVLLAGQDIRGELRPGAVGQVIPAIIEHVRGVMLPRVDAAHLAADQTMALTFVMARCLYGLHTGGVTSKQGAAAWLRQRAARCPELQGLSALTARFAGWYARGRPATEPDLRQEWERAKESFLVGTGGEV